MFEKLKKIVKQWRCSHKISVKRWHWTHGPIGNVPAFVEIEHQCEKCGKVTYSYRKGEEAKEWANSMGDHKRE